MHFIPSLRLDDVMNMKIINKRDEPYTLAVYPKHTRDICRYSLCAVYYFMIAIRSKTKEKLNDRASRSVSFVCNNLF